MSDTLITKVELAIRLGVTPRTVERWHKLGLPFNKIGRLVRYDYTDVLHWVKKSQGEVSGT